MQKKSGRQTRRFNTQNKLFRADRVQYIVRDMLQKVFISL